MRRALVAYSLASTHVQTTLDYLLAFKRFSGFDVSYLHVTHQSNPVGNFADYDVILHSYCARLCFEGYVSDAYRDKLRAYAGIKVLAVQDEYDRTDTLKAAIKDLGFDIVLTCVPQDALEYVYPKAEFPDVTFLTVFTGYVPEGFLDSKPQPKPIADRPIFIGYRGRDIGGRYGRLGFDKFEIGRRMKELCDARGIATDISMDEASRIYGEKWFDFVGDCRAMLGSESGSNVFDFDGSIEEAYKIMTGENDGSPPSYEKFLPIVAKRDEEIAMGQISPRVFECALMRTPMVLFRGRYSDAIMPDEHFIVLEKDFSNFDEVIARIEDTAALEAMTQRTYDHIVASGTFGYRPFVERVFDAINASSKTPGKTAPAVPERAVAVSEADQIQLDFPTEVPGGKGAYQFREYLRLADVYAAEADRLSASFVEQSDIFFTELDRVFGVYLGERERISASSPKFAAAMRALPGDCDHSELKQLLDDQQAFDASRLAIRDALRSEVKRAVFSGLDILTGEQAKHWHDHEVESWERIKEIYSNFSGVYSLKIIEENKLIENIQIAIQPLLEEEGRSIVSFRLRAYSFLRSVKHKLSAIRNRIFPR